MNPLIEAGLEQLVAYLQEKVLPIIEEEGKRLIGKIKEQVTNAFKQFVEEFGKATSENSSIIEVDVLTQTNLVEIAREGMNEISDGVAAYKTETADYYLVYLALVKGKELLPTENNTFTIIKANAIGKDVTKLFKEDELIILA